MLQLSNFLLVLAIFTSNWTAVGADEIYSETCVKNYEKAFNKSGGTAKPHMVAELYSAWCRKYTPTGSGKNRNEICDPLVKKVEEKMMWIPQDENVTPDLACKNVKWVKNKFKENVPMVEAKLKKRDAAEAAVKSKVLEQSNGMKVGITKIAKEALAASRTKLMDDINAAVKAEIASRLGADAEAQESKDMLKNVVDGLDMLLKGMEIKMVQKTEESTTGWNKATLKNRVAESRKIVDKEFAAEMKVAKKEERSKAIEAELKDAEEEEEAEDRGEKKIQGLPDDDSFKGLPPLPKDSGSKKKRKRKSKKEL